ncbi:MAG: DUF1289 domain-containing protein [Woeseiaceae bacterium]|nr:DUF1289 domain-containing protein [Woeseiaceae bacterium]
MTSAEGDVGSERLRSENRAPSPCISICTLDDVNRCLGCGRTLDQIARWALMTAVEQWAIIEALGARKSDDG